MAGTALRAFAYPTRSCASPASACSLHERSDMRESRNQNPGYRFAHPG